MDAVCVKRSKHSWVPLSFGVLLISAGCSRGSDDDTMDTGADTDMGSSTGETTTTDASSTSRSGSTSAGETTTAEQPSDATSGSGESTNDTDGESSTSSEAQESSTSEGSTGVEVSCGDLSNAMAIELTRPEDLSPYHPYDQFEVSAQEGTEPAMDWSGTCSGAGPKQVLALTAPRSGWYTFSMLGGIASLAVLDCTTEQLGCALDFSATSMVTVELQEGQSVAIVLELSHENGYFSVFEGDLRCARAEYDAVPATFAEGITPAMDEFQIDCADGPDVATVFTAPVAGTYLVDAEFGAPFVLRGACGGEVAVCADRSTTIEVTLDEGETVTVGTTVNRFPDRHAFDITLREGECVDQEVESALPTTIHATTSGAGNTSYSRCGGGAAEDRTYRFTASETGTYFFNTFGSEIDTVLTLRADSCTGEIVDCENASGQQGLTVALAAGESVAVTVDGETIADVGEFQLNIEAVSCDPIPLEAPARVKGSTVGGPNRVRPSCENPSMAAENVYAFTAPIDATYAFTATGEEYVTLALFEGQSCDGAELACQRRRYFDPSGAEASLSIPLSAGDQILVVIEGLDPGAQDYTLNVGILAAR